jgi:hypothetical protein
VRGRLKPGAWNDLESSNGRSDVGSTQNMALLWKGLHRHGRSRNLGIFHVSDPVAGVG